MTSILNVGYGTTNPKKLIHLVQNNVALRLQDIRASGDRTAGVEFMNGNSDIFSSNNFGTDWRIINSNALFCVQSGASNIINNVMNFTDLGNVGIGSTQPRSILDVIGNMTIDGHIIPGSNIAYNLGSSSNKWKDLYLSGNSIFLNNTIISSDANSNLSIKDTLGSFKNININTLQLNDGGKQIVLGLDGTGRLTYTNASNIISYAITTTNIASANLDTSILAVDKGGTGVGTFASGELLIGNGTSNIYQNSNLKWDNTNNRLGVGTNAPDTKLHISDASTSNTKLTIQNSYVVNSVSGGSSGAMPNEIVVAGATSGTIGTTDRYISFPYTTDSAGLTGQTQYTFESTESLICDILVVGGGGSGSESHGGGGGAGAVIFMTNVNMNGSYTIKVGKGGVCETSTYVSGKGRKGNDSEIFKTNNITNKIVAEGGGGRGQFANANGGSGGSGGGGDAYNTGSGTGGVANPYTPILDGITGIKYGNNGGNAFGNPGHGGGGGGAGGVGENA